MNTSKNPFSAGRWVIGPAFFGRIHIINNLLNSNETCDWVIGKRRIGKTSLLRQLELIINQKMAGQFALFWDIQGSFDAKGLTDSLIDAIEDSQDEYFDKWESITFEVEENLNTPQILKKLTRAFNKQQCHITLLIDEAEEFMSIGKQDTVLLGKLRKFLQNNLHVHTIISSTPRLEQLHKAVESDTSPFLHGFHASYLGDFSEVAGKALLSQALKNDAQIHSILEKTGCNPYESQLFAKHLFENANFDDTLLQLEANPSLTQVIEVNFELLTPEEKALVWSVFKGRTKLQNFEEPSQKVMLSKLRQLGYLKLNANHTVQISSYFQRQWLETQQGAPIEQAPQEYLVDVSLSKEHHQSMTKQILSIYKFLLELAQDQKKLASYTRSFKISRLDLSIYPDRLHYQLTEDDRQGPSWWRAILETVSLFKAYMPQELDSWPLYRLFQMVEKKPTTYSENDFLDIMMLISEEASLEEFEEQK